MKWLVLAFGLAEAIALLVWLFVGAPRAVRAWDEERFLSWMLQENFRKTGRGWIFDAGRDA